MAADFFVVVGVLGAVVGVPAAVVAAFVFFGVFFTFFPVSSSSSSRSDLVGLDLDGLDVEGMDEMSDLAGEGVGGEITEGASEAAIEAEAATSSFLFFIFLLDSLAVLRSMPKISLMWPPALPLTWGGNS